LASLALKAVASNVYTKEEINNLNTSSSSSLSGKADKVDTYNKTDSNVSFSILQAGIYNKVQISTVDINSRFKILTNTDNNFKLQRKNGTVLYDALDLIFNDTDKTSILKIINIDILASLALKAVASNVYAKEEIYTVNHNFTISLNNKSHQLTTYT
jgi:lipopolysaccharide export LptBFGC system permease protein LptF